ncbi:helix-turn-helix transcriptional regulator [Streptomyces tendae]|uniref:helix-turn-helix transcriptional regulator n=1 Tax=Streptomyces tendae TaxID=1932 RepID=UPI003D71A807
MSDLDGPIIGREDECRQLSLLPSTAQGQALVIRGDAGVGKSALLAHLARQAEEQGHVVAHAVGVEAEWALPFAGLHQLLYPLLGGLKGKDQYPTVLDVVLGRVAGPVPSPMSLGTAILDLLTRVSSRKPVFLVIDDGQWFDAPSSEVCGFIGRRLASSTVKMVVAVRCNASSQFDNAALPELKVGPLPDEAAQKLLDAQHPQLDPQARRTVLDLAEGNPLALLELPRCVERRGGDGGLSSPAQPPWVPLSRRLEQMYRRRLEGLEPTVRLELLRGALDGVESLSSAGSAHGTRYRMRDADEAVAHGLLSVEPASGHLYFRHPLVRSAVVHLATPNERRAAHSALAGFHLDDIERRAGHLAAATVDPDERVAAELEAAADSATLRGGAATAVAWLTRAAELSEDTTHRSRRLGDAAFIAGHSALFDQALQLVASPGEHPGARQSSAAVITSSYVQLYQHGNVKAVHQRLVTAAECLRRRHDGKPPDELLTRLLNLLLIVSHCAGDPVLWEHTERLLDSLSEFVHPLTAIYRDAWGDVLRRGVGVRERVRRAIPLVADGEPWDITRLALSACQVDALQLIRPHLERMIDREMDSGAVADVMMMMHLVMLDQITSGAWGDAEETGRRGVAMTEEQGLPLFLHQFRAGLGLLAALRGETKQARKLQTEVESWARPRDVGLLIQQAKVIGAAASFSDGDFESAYQYASRITRPGAFEPYACQAARTLLDLVEAALLTGRPGEARRHALAARDAQVAEVSPRLALVTLGCLAMTSEETEEARELFSQALEHPAGLDFPFELARLQLAHGMWLRGTREVKEARDVLNRAVQTFQRIGARAWADRADGELRATGSQIRPSRYSTELTPQEWQIAELAASGLSNKEIAKQLLLSQRTVGSHLYHIFPKLGINSRAALRDALSRIGLGSGGLRRGAHL